MGGGKPGTENEGAGGGNWDLGAGNAGSAWLSVPTALPLMNGYSSYEQYHSGKAPHLASRCPSLAVVAGGGSGSVPHLEGGFALGLGGAAPSWLSTFPCWDESCLVGWGQRAVAWDAGIRQPLEWGICPWHGGNVEQRQEEEVQYISWQNTKPPEVLSQHEEKPPIEVVKALEQVLRELWGFPLWRHSNPTWMHSHLICSRSLCLGRRIGPDDLQKSLSSLKLL